MCQTYDNSAKLYIYATLWLLRQQIIFLISSNRRGRNIYKFTC